MSYHISFAKGYCNFINFILWGRCKYMVLHEFGSRYCTPTKVFNDNLSGIFVPIYNIDRKS